MPNELQMQQGLQAAPQSAAICRSFERALRTTSICCRSVDRLSKMHRADRDFAPKPFAGEGLTGSRRVALEQWCREPAFQ
jgi:hypothetical protein